jgi:hypothetical protein
MGEKRTTLVPKSFADDQYRRGYSKGTYAGERDIAKVRSDCAAAIDAFRERAERAEAGLGLGVCGACRHWRRERACAWGTCALTEDILTLSWPWRGEPQQKIITQENFGCVRFQKTGSASPIQGAAT